MIAPKLRFKGFDEDWTNKEFGELVVRVSKHSTKTDKLPRLEYENIKSGFGYIDSKLKNNGKDGIVFKPGDVLFGKLRPYLKKWIYADFNGIAVGDFWVLRCNEHINPAFLYSLIQSEKYNKVANYSAGSKMPRSDWSFVSKSTFGFPKSITEQKMIGYTIKSIERLIKQQVEKLDALKQVKNSYLQNIFASVNENKPMLRNKGFQDYWEIHKLSDFLSIPDKEQADVKSVKDLMTLKLNLKGLEKYSNREALSIGATKYYVRHKGQFIYGKQNIFNGSMAIVTDEFDGLATSGDVPALNVNGIDINYLFMYVSRKDFYKRLEFLAVGTGSKRLHEKDLMNVKIRVPSLSEQKKISSFLSKISDNVSLQASKINKLREIKKGCLQKMFF